MLRQPVDALPPIGPASGTDGVASFRRAWSDRDAATTGALRSWAGRVSGRADRRLLLALVGATEALVAHCDVLAERVSAQEAMVADVTSSFGHEIVQLRAEVIDLRRHVASLRDMEP
jgi:hypothetical protein